MFRAFRFGRADGFVPVHAPAVVPRRHRFGWLIGLLALVELEQGLAIATVAYDAQGDPTTVVQDYFAALGRGDAPAALGYGDVPPGQTKLLTSAALAAQRSLATPDGVQVHDTKPDGDTAKVDVDYTLHFASGDTAVHDTVPVVRDGHGWRLRSSAVPVNLAAGNGSKRGTMVGAVVPVGDYGVFPGALPVSFDTPNVQLRSPARAVTFKESKSVLVAAEVSKDGRAAIAPALDRAFAACLGGTSTVQAACPVPASDTTTAVPGSLRGKTTRPIADSVQLTVDSPDGRVKISGSVPVDAKYSDLDFNNIATSKDAKSISLHAHCYATNPAEIVWDEA
ncbi:hypothetical protein F0L68_26115 [Solihabitans fulvus]|uniref:NTF2-like N-terminal transpeptidase domain-containing protein n=1 Tax=Solihabitans fulvus TaxID=1892852 RepID=A0A5B2WYQ0_9PSEU|nr:hypothetical protein [Solihabitans fulvus]KAA2256731.1 hypothetical protein F0L68_26115 [Solihabitans fulvus]